MHWFIENCGQSFSHHTDHRNMICKVGASGQFKLEMHDFSPPMETRQSDFASVCGQSNNCFVIVVFRSVGASRKWESGTIARDTTPQQEVLFP